MGGTGLADWMASILPALGLRLGLATLAAMLTGAVACGTLIGARWLLARTPWHPSARLLVERVLRCGFVVGGGLWVGAIFGIRVAALRPLLWVAGLAMGLVLLDLLTNVLAGFALLLTRPFLVGDQLESRWGAGVVEAIGWRTTVLRDQGNGRVLVPHALLLAGALVNRGAGPARARAAPSERQPSVGEWQRAQHLGPDGPP